MSQKHGRQENQKQTFNYNGFAEIVVKHKNKSPTSLQ